MQQPSQLLPKPCRSSGWLESLEFLLGGKIRWDKMVPCCWNRSPCLEFPFPFLLYNDIAYYIFQIPATCFQPRSRPSRTVPGKHPELLQSSGSFLYMLRYNPVFSRSHKTSHDVTRWRCVCVCLFVCVCVCVSVCVCVCLFLFVSHGHAWPKSWPKHHTVCNHQQKLLYQFVLNHENPWQFCVLLIKDPWGSTTWYAKAKCELEEGHRLTRSSSRKETSPCSSGIDSLTIHVWYVYLNLDGVYGKCTVGKYTMFVSYGVSVQYSNTDFLSVLQTCKRAFRWLQLVEGNQKDWQNADQKVPDVQDQGKIVGIRIEAWENEIEPETSEWLCIHRRNPPTWRQVDRKTHPFPLH